MKKLFFTLIAFGFYANAFATIRRVNNNPGVVPVASLVYIDFASALSDALNGDTLYIEPSPATYGNVQLSKRITVIGNGYDIGKNQGITSPLPYNLNESKFGNFSFMAGSENSHIIGLRLVSNAGISANGVKITRCRFDTDLGFAASNIFVDQCFFGESGSIFANGLNTNNVVKNTIIGEFIQGLDNVLFDQCYINFFSPSFVTNCTFTNCIIKDIPANCPLTNSFSFCIKIGTGTTFPVAGINNNQEGILLENVFVDADPMTPNPIKDKDFRLKSNSPALGSGTGGVNIGPFGGSTPYRLSGQPPVPVITNFFLSTTGSTSSGLTGSITIQSNN